MYVDIYVRVAPGQEIDNDEGLKKMSLSELQLPGTGDSEQLSLVHVNLGIAGRPLYFILPQGYFDCASREIIASVRP